METMFDNALLYNQDDSVIYRDAVKLKVSFHRRGRATILTPTVLVNRTRSPSRQRLCQLQLQPMAAACV